MKVTKTTEIEYQGHTWQNGDDVIRFGIGPMGGENNRFCDVDPSGMVVMYDEKHEWFDTGFRYNFDGTVSRVEPEPAPSPAFRDLGELAGRLAEAGYRAAADFVRTHAVRENEELARLREEKERRVKWQGMAYEAMILIDKLRGDSVRTGTQTTEDSFHQRCADAIVEASALREAKADLLRLIRSRVDPETSMPEMNRTNNELIAKYRAEAMGEKAVKP